VISPEKRVEFRYPLQIPVRFRCFEMDCTDLEVSTQAVNISRSGLFLISPQRLKLGSLVFLTLHVPTEISGSVFSELRCKGRVVHEQGLKDGAIGYGIEIEQIAPPLRGTREATAI